MRSLPVSGGENQFTTSGQSTVTVLSRGLTYLLSGEVVHTESRSLKVPFCFPPLVLQSPFISRLTHLYTQCREEQQVVFNSYIAIMNTSEFRKYGKEMIDFVANYLESVHERPVLPSVEPFYLEKLIPDSAPHNGEAFEDIFADIERVVMPGVSDFQCPPHRESSPPLSETHFHSTLPLYFEDAQVSHHSPGQRVEWRLFS